MPEPPLISRAERWTRLRRWMRLGLGVKRWLVVYFAALCLMALGIGLLLTHLYRTAPFPEPAYYLTLQFIPRPARGLLFLVLGAAIMAWATLRLVSSFFGLLVPHYRGRLSDALYTQRILSRGPKVVAIGGGTGLSSLLRGLKQHTSNLTAIVTVCDDGGSSGRLRRDLQLLPPGDFRQCIAALADADPLVTRLFEHRFQTAGSDLRGHSFGNLFIAALAQITGSFERALEESGRVLAVRGRILPSTLADVTLCAELADSSMVEGESRIPERAGGQNGHGHAHPGGAGGHDVVRLTAHGDSTTDSLPGRRTADGGRQSGEGGARGAGGCDDLVATRANPIRRVFLQPERPAVYPEVVRSLLDADLVVIGPGSLYTSILPNLLVDDLARALCWSRARKVYVCNVATQPGETDGFDVADHVRVIYEHLEARLGVRLGTSGASGTDARAAGADVALVPFTHVLVNTTRRPHFRGGGGVTGRADGAAALAELGVEIIEADVVDETRPTRHEPAKLAAALVGALAALRPAPKPAPLAAIKALAASIF